MTAPTDPIAEIRQHVAELWQVVAEFGDKADNEMRVADWLDAYADLLAQPRARTWQDIETAPKDGTLIIGALIDERGKIWRIHDMKHNGLAFYTINGGSLPKMTHWRSADPPARAQEPRT